MARDWDDRWRSYPASVPLRSEQGIATSKQRGPMAASWWSRRFTEVLESYGLGTRMQRGRRYARGGQVVGIEVGSGVIAAQVQGSRAVPYLVTIAVREPSEEQWRRVDEAMSTKVGFVARLLGGEVPPDLESVFADAGVSLFPAAWDDLRSTCSCPDWENPCKHIAAVLYLFADQLDVDPWLVLRFRGRTQEALLAAFTGGATTGPSGRREEIAPWWPFAPGPLPHLAEPVAVPSTAAAEHPAAVLDALEPLDVTVGPDRFTDLLRSVYDRFAGPD